MLRADRRRVVPFIGAGLSVEAGVPAADPLPRMLAEKANERGAAIDVRPDFAVVCTEINEQLSHEQLQEIASEVVLEREVVPTAMLRLLARVLSRKSSTANLLVVGAYPNGMQWDPRRGDPAERDEVLANIAAVPLPDSDPVRGPDGPLTKVWSRS